MLKIRRSLKNKKKKQRQQAESGGKTVGLILRLSSSCRMADWRGRVQRHQVRHGVLPRAGRRLQRYASSFSHLVPRPGSQGAAVSELTSSCPATLPVSVAITGIGPDFTSLKSFGDVDAFAEGLVRSARRPSLLKPEALNTAGCFRYRVVL